MHNQRDNHWWNVWQRWRSSRQPQPKFTLSPMSEIILEHRKELPTLRTAFILGTLPGLIPKKQHRLISIYSVNAALDQLSEFQLINVKSASPDEVWLVSDRYIRQLLAADPMQRSMMLSSRQSAPQRPPDRPSAA